MREELDKKLCEKYPKIFANRYKGMQETCMCWGFDHGDGWFNIIDRLCDNIQHHIDWTEKRHQSDIQYNQMITNMKTGDFSLFESYMHGLSDMYREERKAELLKAPLKEIKEPCPQVVADQVKEKLGTLRFYVSGGDEYVRGLISMAESMSAVTCETCGAPGHQRGGGWIHTFCDEHEAEYQEKQKERYNGN